MNTKTTVRDIRVDTPVERVFDFLADPNHLPEVWPNIIEVKNVKKSKINDGFNFSWAYKMSGLPFEGKCETIEYAPYERLVIKSNKGLDSTITWRFQPMGREVHVTLKFEYQIPASLLKRMKDEFVIQETEHEVDALLQNIKSRLELQPVYA
ncbi:MAG TPA: SRPBCC family protein [Anaerolineales bacterium]|jgi:Predicted integral membrane protein